MITFNDIKNKTITDVLEKYPFLEGFFEDNALEVIDYKDEVLGNFLDLLDNEEEQENRGVDKIQIIKALEGYINQMLSFLGKEEEEAIRSISILPGTNKNGEAECFDELKINQSEIICIVGATGSGKSRLLADIEWVAENDTPTSRTILINGKPGDKKWRVSSSNKLVAQLSQNMNFVMDLSVYEFLELHAQSRMVKDVNSMINKIISEANKLAGENFDLSTPITSLSGGQSRALMIADTAILSKSPIVLIDEIENAGIDRKKALALLIGEEKIVLMATHDPLLALMGDRRVVIKNGGIDKIINTSEKEKNVLLELERMDSIMQNLRTKLRNGENIDSI